MSQTEALSHGIQVIFNEIFKDVPLSKILLKAKMLYTSHNLDMPIFKTWLANEITGYKNIEEVPEYRVIHCKLQATLISNDGFRPNFPNHEISCEGELDYFHKFTFDNSIKIIENYASSKTFLKFDTPLDMIYILQKNYTGYKVHYLRRICNFNQFEDILCKVQSKLIDFLSQIKQQYNLKPIQIMETINEQNLSVNGGNQVVVNNNNAQITGNDNTNTNNQNANISTINAGDLEAFKESWANFKAQFAQEKQKNSTTLSTEDAEDIEIIDAQINTIDRALAQSAPKKNMVIGNLKTLSSGISIGVLGNWASNYAIPFLENMIKTAATIFG